MPALPLIGTAVGASESLHHYLPFGYAVIRKLFPSGGHPGVSEGIGGRMDRVYHCSYAYLVSV